MASPSFCNKYKVLKPQPSIAALSKSFHSIPNCKYLLASTNDWSVRKYRQQCASIDQLLSVAEWRYEAIPQIAHSYFLQLLKPNALLKNVEYEVYLEHMQLALAEMKKLIAQESFYLMIQSAKGYQQLISKFKKASVNASTIGLNEHGRCIVWHSSELNAFLPSFDAVSKQNDLIVAIIQILKQRSQPICQGMLSRLIEEVKRKNFSFQNFIQHLYAITLTMKITIPQDLKYLVNQNKILKNVQSIKVKTQAVEPSKNRAIDTKTQRFCPVKTQSRQNSFRGTLGKPQDKRVHRLSDANMLKGIRVTSSLSSKRFVTEKDITQKKQSYLSTNMSSFIASSDKKWNVLRNRSKCTDEEGESNQFNFSKSRQRTVISKCKSSEGRSPSNINIIYARPFDRLIFSENDPVDCLQQERHSMGYGHNSQYSDRANSLRQKQFVPSQTTKIYKSFVIDFGKPIINEKNRCIGEECQEHQSSPNKQKSDESESSVNRSKAEEESAVQEVIKANQWTKNLDSHSLWVQAKLNASIDLGEERRSYLDDVKLQKLEMLSRQMAISRLPEDSAQQLYSQTLIMQ